MGNITSQFSLTNTAKSCLFGNVSDFSVDYQAASIDKIKDIHIYLMKKTVLYKIIQYFPPYAEPEIIKIDLDLSNYATQKDLSNLHVRTSDFTLKTNLAALKTEVDKLDIDKLVLFPGDLAKLSKEVQKHFTKKQILIL